VRIETSELVVLLIQVSGAKGVYGYPVQQAIRQEGEATRLRPWIRLWSK